MLKVFTRWLLRLLYRVEVRGPMPEPGGPLLIVSNHQAFGDGVLIACNLPFDATYLVHTSALKRWYFRIFLGLVPHFAVDTRNPLAVKSIIGLLERGVPVVIFPEGRITVTGSLMKIYDGPAFVAAKTTARVVPVHIDGHVYTWFSRMRGDFPKKLFPKVTLTFHPAVNVHMPEARRARDRRRLASERLRRVMQEVQVASRKDRTIVEAFLDAIKLYGRRRRMAEDIREIEETYGHLLRAALALGRLAGRLTEEGERVGVLMPTANATAGLILGLLGQRRIPAMLNYTAGREGMEHACRIAEVKTVLASRAFVERAKLSWLGDRLADARVVYLEDLRPTFGVTDKLWLILWALRVPRRVMRPSRPEDPAVVLFTSGSEGKPKGVVLSHRSILTNCAQVQAVIELSPRDKFLVALPLFHSFGLTAGMVFPLINGCRIVFYPSPLHYRIIPEFIYDRSCTVLFATGTFLSNYAKFAHPYDFYSLRYVVAGAEKLNEDVRQLYMEKFGIRILEGYGATECSPVIAANTPMAYRSGTVGEILPGMEWRLAPVGGIEQGGVLHVKGPNVMLGYLLGERIGVIEPPQSEFGPGWYNTGDIVTMDAAGMVTITGRLKRFAKVAGEMVSLEVVERISMQASSKFAHAATTWKDGARGELIALFTEDPNLKREHLQAAVRELGLPEIALPRRIIYVEKIPLLGTGKKDYVTLGAMVEEYVRQ
jgi:acyl-[acyl-carrier-protein]-phospholipid O-acyltransferase/long-chain-fatty-acid--[acyl-carrier-protein] ligase